MAEQRIRNKLGDSFDSLSPEVKSLLIAQEKQIMEAEQREQAVAAQQDAVATQQSELSKAQQEVNKIQREVDFMSRNMFRVDRSTPTLAEMETTRSEKRLEQSKEYLELGQQTLAKMNNREITADEGRKIMDDKVIEMKKYMSARYRRESRGKAATGRKKVEKDYLKLQSKGWGRDSFGMEVVHDTTTVVGDLFSVTIPAESEFLQRALVIQESIYEKQRQGKGKELLRPQHYCMGSVEIKGTQRFLTKTSLLPILTPDGDLNPQFMPKLSAQIKELLKRVRDYEEDDAKVECTLATISYTISQWENIRNWYPDQANIGPTMHFEDFTVFLASNEEVNCEQQIVEYLGCNWDPSISLTKMIDRQIMTYLPCQGDIRYVKKFSDLMTDYHEDVANTDCSSIARIIKWNDHMALITNIKSSRRRARIQMRKALAADNRLSTGGGIPEVFVDIEAFQKGCEQVPYLVCWADDDEIYNVSGPDCVEEFVDRLLEKNRGAKAVILYAWYGSGYDYQHIYRFLKKKCTYDECKMRNNAIIYAEFHYEPLDLVVHLKDPYLFILTSLDKAAKAFGVLNKGAFPHEIVKGWGDLDRVLDNWVQLRNETVESYEGKIAMISTNTWEDIEDSPNLQTVLQKATEYCTVDVLAMRQVWQKFSELVAEQLGMQITKSIFTLSQLSMKLMEASLPKYAWLYVPDRKQYDFMREAIYGGRVVARNGDYQEPILYADVVSLYPSAMKLEKHGFGKPVRVDKIDWDKHGIYDVTLAHISMTKPEDCMEFVPRRMDGKLHWEWFYMHRGTYHTYDLIIAKDQGYSVYCHGGWEYPSKGFIFNTFIDRLYKLKDEHSTCNCGSEVNGPHTTSGSGACPIRMVAKIALNGGGYGKFVQKPVDVDSYIVRRDVIAGECARLEENADGEVYFGGNLVKRPTFQQLDGEDYDKMMVAIEADPYYATQVGISILSASRYRLYNLCKQFPSMQVVYSDTDSIFVRKKSLNSGDYEQFKQSCGKELGQLDDTVGHTEHGVIDRMLVGGPKMYAYEYHDDGGLPKLTMHCKGVPTSMLSLKQFEHLLDSKDKKLAYQFAIMRKRLVGVQRLNITKFITQTG